MACYSFLQCDNEPFYDYFNRLEGFLNYNYYNLWEACDICYNGLNEQTTNEIENMFNGRFRTLSINDAWDFFVWFASDVYNRACNVANCENIFVGSMQPHDVSCDSPCEPRTSDFNSISSIAHDEYRSLDCAPSPQYNDDAHGYNVNDPPSSSSCSYMATNDPSYAFNEPYFEGNQIGKSREEEELMGMLSEFIEETNEKNRIREEEQKEMQASLEMIENKIFQLADTQETPLPSSPPPHMSEDPIDEHLIDGEGVESEDIVDFVNPNPLSHLNESQVYECDPSIYEYVDSFEVMSKMYIESQSKTYRLLDNFIESASWDLDEFEMNLPPFMHGFETLGFEIVGEKIVYVGRKEVEVDSFDVFELEGDVDHECSSFENSMIDVHALIGDVRPCGEGLANPFPLPHSPFPQSFDHILPHSFSLPSYLKEPNGEPPSIDDLPCPHSIIVEEMGECATQKFCEESLPFYFSLSPHSPSPSSYFLHFSFDSFSFF